MFRGDAKYCTESVKCSTEVLNIAWRLSNIPRSCQIVHGDSEMFNRGAKYSTEAVKRSTEVLNIPWRP